MSNISVREALELPELQSLEVVAGENGLDREISDVTVLEVPDPVHWLKGGELLLTTFYGIRENEAAQVGLMEKVAPTIAGICFNPGTGTNLTPEIISTADRLALPLLRMPGDMPYAKVIRAILQDILNRRAYLLSRSTDINSMLINNILNGAEAKEVVSTLARLVKNPVALLDASLNLVAEDPYYEGGLEYFRKGMPALLTFDVFYNAQTPGEHPNYALVTIDDRPVRIAVKTVMIKSSVYGYLTVWEILNQFDEVDKYAIAHASTAVALDFIQNINLAEQRQKMMNELCRDLLSGEYVSEESLLKQGEMYGLNLAGLNVVIVVKPITAGGAGADHYRRPGSCLQIDEAVIAIRKQIESKSTDCLVSCNEGEVIIAVAAGEDGERKKKVLGMVREVDPLCKRYFGKEKYMISVGGFISNFNILSQSYSQARSALKIVGHLSGGKKTVFFDELGIYRLLSEMPHTPEVRNYMEMVLPGIDHVDKNILETLEAFIECQKSFSAAGKMLFVHPNTVKYRINKAREMWGDDVVLDNNCLDTLVALKLNKIFSRDLDL